jgi:hypothetical protein
MKKIPLLLGMLARVACGLARAQSFGQEDDITVLTVARMPVALTV